MEPSGLDTLPAGIWDRVAAAEHHLLMLDYDGILAPFRLEREEAVPSVWVTALVGEIASSSRTCVAVISGRPVAELDRLLGNPPFTLVGEHGWEMRRPDGSMERYPLPDSCSKILARGAEVIQASGWETHLERKRTSVVLHTRGLLPEQAEKMERACADLWERFGPGEGMRIVPVNGGVELRAGARDKGTTVRELLAAEPAECLPVYLGDDHTDEDAFQELRARGFGIRVGPSDRASRSAGRLRSAEDAHLFLEKWAALLRDTSPAGRSRTWEN